MSDTVLVFVVEDEALILMTLQTTLEDGGFTVETAPDAARAIAMLEADGAAYKALVTDVNLGSGLSGWDVAKRARELTPELPVVYMSGGNSHEWTANGVPNSILLSKPFAPAQLLTAVSHLLNITAI